MERNEDKAILDQIRELRIKYPDIHVFYEKFYKLVTSVSVSDQKTGWMMYINFINSGSKLLSTKSFKKLNIVEMFVLMRKVIKGGSKVNELMRSFIEVKIKDIGVEAFQDPPVVKYYKPSTLHNMTLSNECLDRSHLKFIKYVEGQLRCKSNRTDRDLAAAGLLYAFRLNRAVWVSSSTLKKESRLYLKPVFDVRADDTEAIEQIADSKSYVKIKEGKAWFNFQRQRGGYANIAIDKMKDNTAMAISRVLSMIKRSTCKEDKLYLREVTQILREKHMQEIVNDTHRVQRFPKMITVFMFSKKASMEFDGVKSINSTAYLSEMLKKLKVPPPVNALEVKTRDLVKSRLDLVSEELKQLRQEEMKKKKKILNNYKAENHRTSVHAR